MTAYKVISLMPSSIVFEDIGIHLPCRGSYAIIDSSAADRSRDLREKRSWVRIETVFTERPKSMIWPFSKPKPSNFIKPSVVWPPPPPPVVQAPPAPPAPAAPSVDTGALQQMLARLEAQQQEIIQILASGRVASSALSNSPSSTSRDSDPMFIPSQIVPSKVESNIRTKSSEVDKVDVDASLEALKKARRAK